MLSPFDLAAAQPILGQPSKKKWMSSLGHAFRGATNSAISSSDVNAIMAAESEQTMGGSPLDPFNGNEVVALTFSRPSNAESFDAFDDIDLAECGGVDASNGTGVKSPSSFGIDMPRVPPADFGTRRLSDLLVDRTVNSTQIAGKHFWKFAIGRNRSLRRLLRLTPTLRCFSATWPDLMNVASDSVRRLSWKSIDSFGQSSTGMESLVQEIANQEVRKKRLYLALASFFIVLVFCYIVTAFFSSEDIADDGVSGDDSSAYIPKFLIPFHNSPH